MVDDHHRVRPHVTPAGFGPADLQSAYKLNGMPATAATIAIVVAFNYPAAESDLAQYRSTFGLPACTKANGCLKIVNQNGATSPLPANAPAGDDWTVEAALDLDMASAACPSCKLLLVEAQDDVGNGLFIAQNGAAMLGASVISNSWGGPSGGLTSDQSLDSQFFTHTGNVTTFCAGGEGNGTTASYPDSSHLVISVGGTRLTRATTTARGWTETSLGTCGSCGSEAKPAFQSAAVSTAVCSRRATVDISAVGDPGLAVFNAASGGFIVVGGTSAAAPLVAAIYARAGVTMALHDTGYLYTHACELFDITAGGAPSGSLLCRAGVGWDGPTGMGTPNGALFGKNSRCATTGATCSHDLCDPGDRLPATGCASPVSGNSACVAALCAQSKDATCCSLGWDSICVRDLGTFCGLACPGN